MKKIVVMGLLCVFSLSYYSCSNTDVKEISGTLIFNDIGDHEFNINADNIEASITMVGPNNGETLVLDNVSLYRTTNYHAKIALESTGALKSELLNNLVVMYQVSSNPDESPETRNYIKPGYIKIDWKGLN